MNRPIDEPTYLGRFEWVVGGKMDGEEEHAPLKGTLGRSHDGGLPVKQIVAHGTRRTLGRRVATQILQLLRSRNGSNRAPKANPAETNPSVFDVPCWSVLTPFWGWNLFRKWVKSQRLSEGGNRPLNTTRLSFYLSGSLGSRGWWDFCRGSPENRIERTPTKINPSSLLSSNEASQSQPSHTQSVLKNEREELSRSKLGSE